eukprot:gb/GECG01012461.1/.p1 GENE.gb/GECG01012461.1/~~gb/GECG01012461.1/.p1  ORF type:complete len:171 (+),score=21.90 gb/GECG01012461.1/:1-513(+)
MSNITRLLTSSFRRKIHAHMMPRQSVWNIVPPRYVLPNFQSRCHGEKPSSDAPIVNVTFIDPQGNETPVQGREGQHILELAHENKVDLEGACEASLACSTCHVILEENVFEKLEEPVEEEEDMLDLAFGLTDTSRLGCQVFLRKDLDGMRVQLPSASRNFYVDGHKPTPH